MADLALLQTYIAGYSALLQTIEVWKTTRDKARTNSAFNRVLVSAKNSAAVVNQATALAPFVPQDIAGLVERRFRNCWSNYSRVIDPLSNVPDEQIDQAEAELIRCACREAKRLVDLTGGNLPDGPLKDFWDAHNCASRN